MLGAGVPRRQPWRTRLQRRCELASLSRFLESSFELLEMFRKSTEGGVAHETQNRKFNSLDDLECFG